MRRRRHLRTRRREVTGIDDEILDLDARPRRRRRPDGADRRGRAAGRAWSAQPHRADGATSSPRSRPSRTRSSASTPSGVLVVQGGPGTGKTAVALHRAAYLLYTHRDRLAPPRRARRRAQPDVPALHRAGAAVARRDQRRARHRRAALPRGRTRDGPSRRRSPRSRAGAEMAGVIAAAVRDRQRVPGGRCSSSSSSRTVRARPRRRQRRPHPGPPLAQAAQRGQAGLRTRTAHRGCWPSRSRARSLPGGDGRLLDAGDLAEIRDELQESRELRAALDALWPTLTPSSSSATSTPTPDGSPRPPGACPPPTARCWPGRCRTTCRGALDPRRRAAARRGRRAARRRRPRRGRRRAQAASACARRSMYAQGVLDVARPGGGPRPRAAARHRRDRRRPARRAPGRAPLRLHGRPRRRRPRVGVRARDRRRGAGAVGRWRGGCSCAAARRGR